VRNNAGQRFQLGFEPPFRGRDLPISPHLNSGSAVRVRAFAPVQPAINDGASDPEGCSYLSRCQSVATDESSERFPAGRPFAVAAQHGRDCSSGNSDRQDIFAATVTTGRN